MMSNELFTVDHFAWIRYTMGGCRCMHNVHNELSSHSIYIGNFIVLFLNDILFVF